MTEGWLDSSDGFIAVLAVAEHAARALRQSSDCRPPLSSVVKVTLRLYHPGVCLTSRRGAALGVPTPIMSTLYAVLKLHAQGQRAGM